MPDVIITPSSGIIEFKPSSTTVNKIEASGNTFNLVNTANASGTIFNIEATNGSLFSVVDDLDGTLMSVNNNAGLPVLEVFSDDKIVGGRFGQNDFVVSSSGNVGIGVGSPSHKLDVKGTLKLRSDLNSVTISVDDVYGLNIDNNVNIIASNFKISDDLGDTFVIGTNGSITAGSWNASTIAVNKGGTGATTFTTGEVLVGNGTGAVSTLSRSGIDSRSTFPPAAHSITTHSATAWRMFFSNATTSAIQQLVFGNAGTYLRSGGASANPTWATIAYSELSGTPTIPTVNNATLTLNVSGTGLTGSQTFTANQSSNATFTVTSNATSANTDFTIVARDEGGNFSAGTITATLAGNASTVTNGVYTTGNQSVGGVKTFTSQIINTTANSTTTGGGQIYLNGATGNRIDFNTNGVAPPTFTTRSAGTKIVLYPEVGASTTDYAIGIESGTQWFSIPGVASRQFKWYGGTTNIATLTGAGVFSVAGSTSQINVDNLRLDGNTLSATNTNGNLFLNSNGTGSVFVGGESISFKPSLYQFKMEDSGPYTILDVNASDISFRSAGTAANIYALYIDRLSDSAVVGIGTNAPAQFLHVAGNILCDKLYLEKTSAPTISSNTLTINLTNSQLFLVSLNSNITTLTISNTPATSNITVGFTIIFTADGTARSVTWPASVKWPGGTAPTLTSTNAKRDVLSFVSTDNGTTWLGFVGGQDY